ncbi:uncharacterized protein K452DRAFT_348023 [Neofusicoccum parvum]|uniref:Uncharacterized protein K452DRAFT_348023 n=1 Tax=Neofusicoccum parvum TaxID=310453 RepID=A0ACB5SAU5_9PEZI|nr:uncharacterized protein K452DRAFT_348023 [Neofusicoccum parvum]
MDVTRLSDHSSIFSAKDLVIVITGGGSGIGHAMAAAVYKTGAAKVYILGRRHDVLTKAAKAIDPTGTVVVPVQCDVDSIASVTAAGQAIEHETGYIDVLINNAARPEHPFLPPAQTIDDLKSQFLTGMDDGSALSCFQTNAMSVIACDGYPACSMGNQKQYVCARIVFDGDDIWGCSHQWHTCQQHSRWATRWA